MPWRNSWAVGMGLAQPGSSPLIVVIFASSSAASFPGIIWKKVPPEGWIFVLCRSCHPNRARGSGQSARCSHVVGKTGCGKRCERATINSRQNCYENKVFVVSLLLIRCCCRRYSLLGCFVAVVADVRESFCTADSLLLSSLLLLLRLLVCLLLLLLLLALRFVVVVLVGVVAVVYFSHCCTKGNQKTTIGC